MPNIDDNDQIIGLIQEELARIEELARVRAVHAYLQNEERLKKGNESLIKFVEREHNRLAMMVELDSLQQRKLIKPPAYGLRRVLEFVFTKSAFETHFAEQFVDLWEESNELDAQGRTAKRRWITFVYYLAILRTFALFVPNSLLKFAIKIWKSSQS